MSERAASGKADPHILGLPTAAIATATAPATVLSVFREERAKGLMVKTALASVALDNVICIILFTGAIAWVPADQAALPPAGRTAVAISR